MAASDNKEIVRGFFADISKGDFDGALARMADDMKFTLIGTTRLSGTCNSKKEFVDRVLAPLGSQLDGALTVTVDNFIAEGDSVVVQSHGRAKTRSGKNYNNTYCQVFKVAGGKIKQMVEYLDTELVTECFGR